MYTLDSYESSSKEDSLHESDPVEGEIDNVELYYT